MEKWQVLYRDNQTTCFYPNAFLSLATFKFVADGGSNRLYDAFRDDTQSLEKSVEERQFNLMPEPFLLLR